MRSLLARSAAVALLAAAPAAYAQQRVPATSLAGGTQVIALDRVVAVVGDVVITQSDVTERLVRKRGEGVTIPADSAGQRTFVRSVITELVDEELLTVKGKDLKVEVPDADVTNTVDKQLKEIRGRFGSEGEYRGELAKAGYGTPDEYKRFLTEQVRRDEMIQRTVRKLREDGKMVPANVTDAEVEEAYERNKATLPKRESSVGWRQIIVAPRPTAEAKERTRVRAESLLVELKAGAPFEALAKRESMDPGSKDNGGDLGWNRRGKMVPEFERWMFGLAPGQLSPVIETAFGYHVIRVDRIQAGEVRARHILLTPVIDSADIARARSQADSVAAAWRRGAAFDSLAKANHDFRSGEETTLLTPYPRAQLPTAYQQGFADRKAGDLVVFPIAAGTAPAKFVVAQIASMQAGGEMTLPEVKERFRSRLAEEGGVKRLMESLRKSTYVHVNEDAVAVAALPPAAP